MSALGSYRITSIPNDQNKMAGSSWSFATANFDEQGGMPSDQLISQEEELMDVGVSGRRWRQVHKQYQSFLLHTTADAATYADAILLKQNYLLTRNAIGDLAITLYGSSYKWVNVKVQNVVVKLVAGTLVGNGASSPSLGVVYADWTMILADVTKSGFK